MPAAAVIPARLAYINVVAVKKLVVEFNSNFGVVSGNCYCSGWFYCWFYAWWSLLIALCSQRVYFEKIRVLKAGFSLNTVAWNNKIRLRFYFVGFRNRSND